MPLVISATLALLSAAAYAVSAALQHREASRTTGRGSGGFLQTLARRPIWWLSFVITAVGAVLHLFALAFGPLVLVQPVGVMALVFALPVGAWLGGLRVTNRAWAGAICVLVGLPGMLAVVPTHPVVRRAATSYGTAALVIGVATAVLIVIAVLVGRRRPGSIRSATASAVLFAVAAALVFGLTSGAAKAVWIGAAGPVVIAVWIVSGPVGIILTQYAYRGGGLGAPLAVLTLGDPICAAALGVVVLGEPLAGTPLRVLAGVVGLVVTVVGVVLLAPHATEEKRREPAVGV